MRQKQIILLATEHSPSPCKSRSHCSSHMHELDVNEATRISLHEDFLQGRGLAWVRRHVLNARTTRTRARTATASSAAEAAGCGHPSRPSRRMPGMQKFCFENLKLGELILCNIIIIMEFNARFVTGSPVREASTPASCTGSTSTCSAAGTATSHSKTSGDTTSVSARP